MSLLKTNEIQNYNGSSLTLTASTVSTSAQLNTGGNISVTGSLNVSDDSTTRTNLGLGTIATQDSDSITVTGGTATLGALTVSGSDSGDLVRITQTGSGNALVVEDSANPDSTPFVVDSSGNVGIGTSPSTILHVQGTDTTPVALRIENTTPTTGKTWQIGSTNAGVLQLATIVGVADYLTVDTSGNVLVGSSSKYAAGLPGNVVQINATGDGGLVLGNGTSNIAMYRDLVNNVTHWYNGTNQASLTAAGAWTNASDARLKTNVREIKYGLETVLQTQPRTFERIDVDGTYIGFVAQELQTVIPEVVSGDPEKQLGIDYGSLVAVAFKAIQEQQTLIESQQSQILELTTRIEALETT